MITVSNLVKRILDHWIKSTPEEKKLRLRDYEAALSELLNSNKRAFIIELLPFTLDDSADARPAADTIHSFIAAMPIADLADFESTLHKRSPYSSEWLYVWRQLSPQKLGTLERFGEASSSLLGIASFHWNGYVREEAIRRLARLDTGVELPFLILRLNDWVVQVRAAALAAVYSRFKPEYCRAFIASLVLLPHLERAGRVDQKEILAAINQLLLSDECRAGLLDSLKSEDRFIRRASFRLALMLKNADLRQVVELALNEDDTLIRSCAAHTISTASDARIFEPMVDRLKNERFMPLRRASLRFLIKQNSPRVVDELRTALLDPHASIREEARYHLKKIQPLDVADFYRQKVLDAVGPTLHSAISGLGETGSAADDQFVVPYTSHPTTKIRMAALKALAVLNPKQHLDIFMRALEDEAPKISRRALKALESIPSLLNAARVWEVFSSSPHTHVRRNALSLIERLSKWESIPYLLAALSDKDEDLVLKTRREIEGWLSRSNRTYSYPTTEQATNLKNALEKHDHLLDDETRQQLHLTIRAFVR